jgi:signal transduction histidine kinase
LGNAFFSIAFLTAIVAMCAHEVNRGLILLLSTFCGAALCALIFFTLVIGTMAVVAAPAIEQANASLKQMRAAQARFANKIKIATSDQQRQSTKPGIDGSTLSLPPNSLIKSRSSQTTQNTQSLATRQAYAIEQANQAAPQAESDRARQREAVEQAEAERDRINARDQKLEQIQKSIDWYETNIRDYQSKGWDGRFLEQERDELIKQRWDLEGR